MENNRAIPQGYMTVGQLAKRMGITVRTLQYYDNENVLKPCLESAGGRRLYGDKELVQLHQILSLKSLGFSLEDIRHHLATLDTPQEVAAALTQQAQAVRQQMDTLAQALEELEALRGEVLQMQSVNFKKYADIIANLQMKNEYYWMIKHFDDDLLDHIRQRFDRDSGLVFMKSFQSLQEEALSLLEQGIAPGSPQGQDVAQRFWALITQFTGGDMALLAPLIQMGSLDGPDATLGKQLRINEFIEPALDIYFTNLGQDPLQEVPK